MTNDIELQTVLNDMGQHGESIADAGGILGLGWGPSLILSGILFWVIAYIFGAINGYRAEKKWLKPNARYFMNIFKAWGVSLFSLAGVAVPAPQVERSDAYYYNPTQEEFIEALIMVHQMMIDGGWTLKAYQKRAKDCEDYAQKMAVELRNYIATTFTANVGAKGVAIGNIGYTRKDGAGHVLVNVILSDDSVKYYEPYPGDKYLTEKLLTDKEIDSINMNIM